MKFKHLRKSKVFYSFPFNGKKLTEMKVKIKDFPFTHFLWEEKIVESKFRKNLYSSVKREIYTNESYTNESENQRFSIQPCFTGLNKVERRL